MLKFGFKCSSTTSNKLNKDIVTLICNYKLTVTLFWASLKMIGTFYVLFVHKTCCFQYVHDCFSDDFVW